MSRHRTVCWSEGMIRLSGSSLLPVQSLSVGGWVFSGQKPEVGSLLRCDRINGNNSEAVRCSCGFWLRWGIEILTQVDVHTYITAG